MKKFLILLTILSASAFSQREGFDVQFPAYECNSPNAPYEHTITLYRHFQSNQYTSATYFDNTDLITLNCDRANANNTRNNSLVDCYGKEGRREVLVSFSFSGRSTSLQANLVDSHYRSDEDPIFYRCKRVRTE